MHEQNEYGKASHFRYKYGNKSESAEWIKALIKSKDEVNQSLSEKSTLKLFEDTIFVFTPKGELITLPNGATPVDFAYAVHTEIGDQCTGAKIDGKLCKLDTILKSGQTIEITTNRSHKPVMDWLDFVKTPLARREIKLRCIGGKKQNWL